MRRHGWLGDVHSACKQLCHLPRGFWHMKTDGKLATTHVASDEEPTVVILSLERCLMTFINFYIEAYILFYSHVHVRFDSCD